MSAMITPLDSAIAAAARQAPGTSGITRIASACGTSKQFIGKMRRDWRLRGAPPRAMRRHAPAIERACNGAVTVEQLCPDVRWERDAQGGVTCYSVPVTQEPENGAELIAQPAREVD